MRAHILSFVAAFFTLAACYLAGVLLLLNPVSGENASAQLLPLPVAFVVAITVYVSLFVWIERMIGAPFRAAMAIVLSQMALVNVDFVLSGKRDVATAAASTIILFVSWSAVAWVYGRCKPKNDLTRSAPPSSATNHSS